LNYDSVIQLTHSIAAVRVVRSTVQYFFSSRRRHTRWPRDWSSDVCSSDLSSRRQARAHRGELALVVAEAALQNEASPRERRQRQIGRASCRERVWRSGGGGCLE